MVKVEIKKAANQPKPKISNVMIQLGDVKCEVRLTFKIKTQM